MKKIYSLLPFLIMGVFIFTSCKQEVEDYFDKSASERMEGEIVKYRDLLTKPQNGWIIEYYPGGSNQVFGGYAVTVKFTKEGNAIFQSSIAENVNSSSTSLYSLKKDVGPTLNFNTYNKIFHYFSDPDINDGDGRGKGLVGDYEFILKSGTETEILMHGKKHGSAIRMYPLQEPATTYLEKAKKNRDSYAMIPAVGGLEGTFAGKPVKADIITSQHFMLTQDNEQVKFSFMFTDKGVKLYAPITLNGKTVNELEWKADERAFVSPDKNTKLSLIADPLGLRLDQLLGNYSLAYASKKVDVTIAQTNNGQIVMTGLPFEVKLKYNTKKGALELNAQQLKTSPDVRIAIWALPPGTLSWGAGYGLVTKWNGNEDNFVLNWVDNGFEWFAGGNRIYATAFILWEVGKSVYNGYGDARFTNLVLTKKK